MQAIEAGKAKSGNTVHRTVGRLIVCVLALFGWKLASAAAGTAEGFTLEVRPRVCVVMAGEVSCSMQLQVNWTAPQEADICLRFAGEEQALQCWQSRRQGAWNMPVEREQNTTVQLVDPGTDAVLLESLIPVLTRELRDSRKRRRHVWSIL